MNHGIYLITRGPGTPGDYQLLRQHAYNNRFAGSHLGGWTGLIETWEGDFWPAYQVRPCIVRGFAGTWWTNEYGVLQVINTDPQYFKVTDYYPSGWSSWTGLWRFVQDDGGFGLLGTTHIALGLETGSTYRKMGPTGRFLFPTPSGSGTITNVSVWAQISGGAKTVLRIGSTDYEGVYEDHDAKLDWIHTDYATKPDGSAWAWADLAAGELKAGVWLDIGYVQTARTPQNLIATAYIGATSTCNRVKVRIDFIEGGVAKYVEIWPNWDSNCDDLAIWVGNTFALDALPAYEGIESPRFILSGPIPESIESDIADYPSSENINTVTISYEVYTRTYYEIHTVQPYIIISGVKYYGAKITLPVCPSVTPANNQSFRYINQSTIMPPTSGSHAWATNPATGGAWTKTALQSARYGLEFKKSATPLYTVPEFFVRSMSLTMVPASGATVTNTHGSLSGTITPAHCYPGYESKSTGTVRRWHSNVGEMPPGDLAIGKVRIYFNYRSFSQSGTNYVRPFIYVHGAYHYGTKQPIRSDPHVLDQCSYEWPAGAFSASELANCTWGLEFYCSSLGWLWPTVLDIEFEYAKMQDQATYSLLAARFLSLEKNFQVPITPDILKFATEVFIPERAEIAYFWNGACVFQGLAWTIDERAEDYTITAKSQQVILEHRALPEIHSTIVSGSAAQYIHPTFRALYYQVNYSMGYTASPLNTLGEILSSDRPSFLFNQFNATYSIVMPVGDNTNITDARRVGRYVHLVESNLGALFTANSYVPPGAADGVTLRGIAPHIQNRALYTFGKNVSPVQNDFTSPAALVKGPNPPGSGEYYLGAEDLILNSPIDTNILLADNWADTHIRARYIEHALEYLNQEYHFDSIASVFLNNLFTLLGQEVRFQPSGKGDAIVYMDVADMLCRGSETAPIHVDNCVSLTGRLEAYFLT